MDSRELDHALPEVLAEALPDLHDLRDDDDLHLQAVVDFPLKRAGCDLDGDQSTAKKRRKQSKPVRINAGPGALPGGRIDLPAPLGGEALGDVLAEVDIDAPVSPSLDLEVQVHCQTEVEAGEVADGREEIPLNLCSLPKTEPSSPTGLEDFPAFPPTVVTKSGSPGGGLEVDLTTAGQSERLAMNNFWGMAPPFLYPMMAPQPDQHLPQPMPQAMPQAMPQTQANSHQSRCSPDNRTGSCTIFNPDAYCELCNKEFCNKYFLKTHKANKHGIFTNSPGQQQQPPPPPPPPQQQPQQQPQSQPQPQQTPPAPPQQQQQTSPSGIPGDAFQHGLLPPRTLSPSSDSLGKMSSSPVRLQKDVISAKHSKNLFQRKIKVKSFGSNGDVLPPLDRVEDEYFDADRLLMSPQSDVTVGMRPGDEAAVHEEAGEGGSAGDSNESTGILRKDNQAVEIPEKPVFTPEKMRSLGVINPEAFCEICCKEYCNKYFLRTHKWKRHGIAPPEGEEKESSRPAPSSWMLQQHAAPLNLIMEDPQGDAICKYCGQWFPSEQVLQVHVAFVHLPSKKEKDADSTDMAPRKGEALLEGDKAVDRNQRVGGERKAEQIESIMDDMKKVQSMLFQLNNLNANQIQHDDTRSQNINNAGSSDETGSGSARPSGDNPGVTLPCTLCKKSFADKTILQQHMQDQHWNGPAPQVKAERDLEASAEQPEPKPVAPTSSYCEICNKELCNKYFMKTHMQRMHGIEIENGSQIGGVVCDICNKELCSKYFLRVHKQNTHGIVDETSGPPTQVRDTGSLFSMAGSHFLDANNQALKPTDLSEMSHRYFTHFNEVCNICNRRFRSVKWLKAHLMNDHGRSEYEAAAEANDRLPKLPPPPPPGLHPNDLGVQLGLGPMPAARERGREGKGRHRLSQDIHCGKNGNLSKLMQGTTTKEYRCNYCPFSTPVLAFLYVHEKTHTGLAFLTSADQKRDLQCPICFKTCTKPEQFQRHLLSHQFAGLPAPGAMFADPRSAMFAASGSPAGPTANKEMKRPTPSQPRGNSDREEENAINEPDGPNRIAEPARHRDGGEARERRGGKCPKCGGEVLGDRCTACGLASSRKERELSSLQSLLKETVTSDVKKRLEDAAKVNDIPASYAVPKTQDSDPFIMQPFIIEEPCREEDDRGVGGGAPSADNKFVPSLVFLPVKEKLSRPLTASFTLTPA